MTHVNLNGPFFDGRAHNAVGHYLRTAERHVAQEAKAAIDAELPRVLKNPTGNYQRHINVKNRGDHWVVNDRGIIYGPWLEGTGSRNRTTRFKGYSTFRRVRRAIETKAGELAETVLPPYLRDMNGGAS